jgi:beta-glucosidase
MRDRQWAEAKARVLVGKMTLEEKVSQLRFDAPGVDRLGVPAYNWWNEALHGVARAGVATVFPQAIALAAMFDEDAMKAIGEAIATEGRAKFNVARSHGDRDIYKGLTFWSPNVNIFRDPRWGRGQETYGEDPYLTSRLGVAFVKGLQGDGRYLKAAACAKHFAVHSGPEKIRHSFDAVASKKDMAETYLPAFKALVTEAEVEAVMGAYNRTNGEPCCANTVLMDYLRKQWKFAGHFVSDCWAIKDFHENHKVTGSPTESVSLALKTGCDLNCGCTYQHILEAFKQGLVTERMVDESAIRLFTTRFLLGMFEKTPYDEIGPEVIESKEHVALAVEAARKSTVLLKNDGILPLKKEEGKVVGVIGPNADNRLALVGNYHGTSSRYITMLEGIADVADRAGMTVRYGKGSELYLPKTESLAEDGDRIAEALSVAEQSDVVVLCLGLDETLEGEEFDESNSCGSGDKDSLHLPAIQERLMQEVLAVGKPTVVLVLTGSAVDLSYADAHADAVLQVWYPGARGGKAVADILFGDCSPSGKLPVTFYRSAEALPAFTDYSMGRRTYRYTDEENVLYPFGFGLSYGKNTVSSARLVNPVHKDTPIFVEVGMEGSTDAEDVLQVYVKDHDSPYAVKNVKLCAFKRVRLAAGQKAKTLVEIPASALESVDENGKYGVYGNHYTLYVGFSQPDSRSVELVGSKPQELEFTL